MFWRSVLVRPSRQFLNYPEEWSSNLCRNLSTPILVYMRHVSEDCEYLNSVFTRILYPQYLFEHTFDMLSCRNTSGIICQLIKFRYVVFLW